MNRCKAHTRQGHVCKNKASSGSFCSLHSKLKPSGKRQLSLKKSLKNPAVPVQSAHQQAIFEVTHIEAHVLPFAHGGDGVTVYAPKDNKIKQVFKVTDVSKPHRLAAFYDEVVLSTRASAHKFGPKVFASGVYNKLGVLALERYDQNLDEYLQSSRAKTPAKDWFPLLMKLVKRMVLNKLVCWDLKPGNVLVNVDRAGNIMKMILIDFEENACVVDKAKSPFKTESDDVIALSLLTAMALNNTTEDPEFTEAVGPLLGVQMRKLNVKPDKILNVINSCKEISNTIAHYNFDNVPTPRQVEKVMKNSRLLVENWYKMK